MLEARGGADHRRLADRPLRAAEGGARLPRLQRPDHPHRRGCWRGRTPAPGCNTSSTRASTTSCSTRRRTPAPTSGRWCGGWPRSSSPASARATMSTARSLRSATKSSRSIPSRAPIPGILRRDAADFFDKRVRDAKARFEHGAAHAGRSARPTTCCRGRQGLRRRQARARHHPRSRSDRAQGDPLRRAGLCRDLAVDRRRRGRGAGRLDASRSTMRTAPAVQRRRGGRQDDRRLDRQARDHRRQRQAAGRRATCWCWCASATASSTRCRAA